MIVIRRRLSVFIVAASVLGVVSSCHGSSSPKAAGPGPASTTTSTTPATAPAVGGSDQFCTVVKQQEALFQGGGLAALLTGGGVDAWKAYLAQTATMNQQLVDTAPAEIQPDVKTLQGATLDLQTTMAANDYDVQKIGSAKLIGLLRTPERTAATTKVVTYVKTNCGIDLTKPAS
jgi:hypothetical protein